MLQQNENKWIAWFCIYIYNIYQYFQVSKRGYYGIDVVPAHTLPIATVHDILWHCRQRRFMSIAWKQCEMTLFTDRCKILHTYTLEQNVTGVKTRSFHLIKCARNWQNTMGCFNWLFHLRMNMECYWTPVINKYIMKNVAHTKNSPTWQNGRYDKTFAYVLCVYGYPIKYSRWPCGPLWWLRSRSSASNSPTAFSLLSVFDYKAQITFWKDHDCKHIS